MQVAVRQLLLVELDQLARGEALLDQLRGSRSDPSQYTTWSGVVNARISLYPPIDPWMSPCHALNHNIWRPEPVCIMML